MTSPIAERLRARNERYQAGHGNYLYYAGGDSILDCEAAAEIDALRLALAEAEERAKTLQSEMSKLDAVVHALGIEDSEDDPAEAIAELISERNRDDRIFQSISLAMGGTDEWTDRETMVNGMLSATEGITAKVTTLEADLSRAVEQCLEQQKLLDEYKAVHVAVCAERDYLHARCAELEGSGWQQMGTFPRDGSEFIAVHVETGLLYTLQFGEPQVEPEYCLYGDGSRYKIDAFRLWFMPPAIAPAPGEER